VGRRKFWEKDMKKRLYVLVIIASVLVNVAQPKERFVKAKDEIIMILLK
jgi:hypothetical protein